MHRKSYERAAIDTLAANMTVHKLVWRASNGINSGRPPKCTIEIQKLQTSLRFVRAIATVLYTRGRNGRYKLYPEARAVGCGFCKARQKQQGPEAQVSAVHNGPAYAKPRTDVCRRWATTLLLPFFLPEDDVSRPPFLFHLRIRFVLLPLMLRHIEAVHALSHTPFRS